MKNEFVLAFNEVLEDKQLPKEVVLEALQAAMVSAYRRAVNASNAQHVEAKVDPESGKVTIFAEKEIVDSVNDMRTEVTLNDALMVDPDAKMGGMVVVETTPRNFGRVAAQTARQVIQQRIREAERDSQVNHFTRQIGEIMSGVVQAVSSQQLTLGLDMKAEGIMPRSQQIPGERFRVHDRVRALLIEVKSSTRGPQIILSRAHRNFLRRLLENEVPEIYHGMVEIRSIAREPGQRSKVAVAALQPGVDPVGACVGIRGVRIQAIVRELNDEKIDVIEWSSDPAVYISKALSPARVSGVYLIDTLKGAKTATVVVPEDQLSLAIGRDGQNARLAAKLTGWRIDIKSLPEAAADSLHRLQGDAAYAMLLPYEQDTIPQIEYILGKKSEGRPVTPEEYSVLTQFVDRIERGLIRQRQSERRLEEERQRVVLANIPAAAFEIPIASFQVSERLFAVISEAGYATVGDLLAQMANDPDSILGLSGMGPKGMRELETALSELEARLRSEEAAAQAIPEELPVEPVAVTEIVSLPVEEEQPELPAITEIIEEPEAIVPEELTVEAVLEPVLVAPAQASEDLDDGEKPTVEEDVDALDALFTLRAESMEYEYQGGEDEEDEESEDGTKKKSKKKKKKFVEVEYDPDADMTIVKKKRKRSDDWGGDW